MDELRAVAAEVAPPGLDPNGEWTWHADRIERAKEIGKRYRSKSPVRQFAAAVVRDVNATIRGMAAAGQRVA